MLFKNIKKILVYIAIFCSLIVANNTNLQAQVSLADLVIAKSNKSAPTTKLLLSNFNLYKNNTDLVQVQGDTTPPNDPQNPQTPGIKSGTVYIPKYEAGQGGVSLGGGVIFPLFYQNFVGDFFDTNLTVGGHIWFEWDIFLWQALSTGMEISGMFALTPNSRSLFMAPITAHLKYVFQAYPVEFPISLGIGMNMISLGDSFKVDFILKPKIGSTYRINQNWIVGLFTSYWFIVQSYSGYNINEDYNMLANFLDLTAGFSYVF